MKTQVRGTEFLRNGAPVAARGRFETPPPLTQFYHRRPFPFALFFLLLLLLLTNFHLSSNPQRPKIMIRFLSKFKKCPKSTRSRHLESLVSYSLLSRKAYRVCNKRREAKCYCCRNGSKSVAVIRDIPKVTTGQCLGKITSPKFYKHLGKFCKKRILQKFKHKQSTKKKQLVQLTKQMVGHRDY